MTREDIAEKMIKEYGHTSPALENLEASREDQEANINNPHYWAQRVHAAFYFSAYADKVNDESSSLNPTKQAKAQASASWYAADELHKTFGYAMPVEGPWGLPAAETNENPLFRQFATNPLNPEISRTIPEVATLRLSSQFRDIQDPRTGDQITKEALQEYASRPKILEVDKLSAEFAIRNFDKLAMLDPDSKGISHIALKQAETILSNLEFNKTKTESALNWEPSVNALQKNYDAIQPDENLSITSYDLQKCHDRGCAPEQDLDQIRTWFGNMAQLDDQDGAANYWKLGFSHYNADGITRSDLKAATDIVTAQRARLANINSEFNDWFQ